MRKGFSMMEVLISLVILGIGIEVFFRITSLSQKNVGNARNWQLEADLIAKTVEGMRNDSTVTALQQINRSWIDSSMGQKVRMRAVGSQASHETAPDFPRDMVAQLEITAARIEATDSLVITTVLWCNQ